ncbi:MAG: NADH:ubiquinone reductase (Na(+)-transporting) subunit C [bacterium]|nr:NADH:ubiquinone reductase (Na(+)-transporting) subunit C [bacterium]
MNLNSNSYVLGFVVAVCIGTSLTLALTANALKETQAAAAEFDRKKNVMIAAGLCTASDERSREELEQLYKDRVSEFVIDTESGKPDAEMKPADADGKRYRVVATTKGDGGAVEAYVLPISGRGLWSTLRGYLALDGDKNHVRGITFYEHKETPGLGGEVDNPSWQAQWKGKTVLDEDGKLISITVKKGQVNPAVALEKAHAVDGLAGATITAKGVQTFVKADLQAFSKYLYE